MSKPRPIYFRDLDWHLPSVREAAEQMLVSSSEVRYIAKRTAEGKYAATRKTRFRCCYADEIPDKWPERALCKYGGSTISIRRSDGVEYSSMAEAARANNVSRARICAAVQKKSAIVNGYQWRKL